jgi:hypothetical protein
VALGKTLLLCGVVGAAGCSSTTQQRVDQNEAVRQEAAREVRRICSLPEAERGAKIEELKKESHMSVHCGVQ